MSRVVIAGGSGYLGRALAARLAREGHDVAVLTRASSKDEIPSSKGGPAAAQPSRIRYAGWTPNGTTGAWSEEVAAADAVVNLAGAGIADRRWTESRKREVAGTATKVSNQNQLVVIQLRLVLIGRRDWFELESDFGEPGERCS